MPPSIPPAKGSDPEDVAWALQTADALWRRSERTDALVWLRRAVQAAGEADDPERAFALADAAAELTEQMGSAEPVVPIRSAPPPRLHPDASGSIEISMDMEVDAPVAVSHTSFPPGAGAEIDDLLGSDERTSTSDEPPPSDPAQSDAPASAPPVSAPPESLAVASAETPAVPLPPPTPPPARRAPEPPPLPKAAGPRPPPLPPRKKLPPTRLPPLPPPSSPESLAEPLSLSDPSVVMSPDAPPSSAVPSRPIPLPRGALFEDSTPFLPSGADSDEHESVSLSSRSGEHLAQGFDSLVRRPSSPMRAAESSAPDPHPFTVPAPPQITEPPPEIRELEAAPTSIAPEVEAETSAEATEPPTMAAEAETSAEATEPPAAASEGELSEPVTGPPSAQSMEALESEASEDDVALPAGAEEPAVVATAEATDAPPAALSLDAEAFADIPDEARDAFAAAASLHELAEGEEVPAVALCYVLEGEVRVSSAVVDAAGLILKPGEVLRARGTIEASLPLRLSAHSESAKVATWAAHAVEDAFAACPWVEADLRETANRTLAICGATIGPLGERLDESIFLDAMARFEVLVLLPNEVFIEQGSPLPGLCIVGVGEILGADAPRGPGDFVFPEGVLTLAPSPVGYRAGAEGALVLTASRAAAQELLVTCPPLLEILAGM